MARLLHASVDGSELADRIVAGLAHNGELDLEPRSPAEKSALELALTELSWAEPGGRLLPRLRVAVAEYAFAEVPAATSLDQTLTDDARSAAHTRRPSRSQVRVAQGDAESKKSR